MALKFLFGLDFGLGVWKMVQIIIILINLFLWGFLLAIYILKLTLIGGAVEDLVNGKNLGGECARSLRKVIVQILRYECVTQA